MISAGKAEDSLLHTVNRHTMLGLPINLTQMNVSLHPTQELWAINTFLIVPEPFPTVIRILPIIDKVEVALVPTPT